MITETSQIAATTATGDHQLAADMQQGYEQSGVARLNRSLWHYLTNLTPHTVHVITPHYTTPIAIESRGVARCEEIITALPDAEADIYYDHYEDSGMHITIPLVAKRYGNVTGLPAAERGRLYIVSQIVADACPDRGDLVVPHDVVRDDAGRIMGCRGFSRPDRAIGRIA